MYGTTILRYVFFAVGFLLLSSTLRAQQADTTRTTQLADSLSGTRPLSLSQNQTVPAKADITFRSRDSLRIQLKGLRIATLYGSAQVTHTEGTLESGIIRLDLEKSEMEAKAIQPLDTLSQPVLRRGNEEIRSERIQFNYKTAKGRFEVARVRIDQGQVRGAQVKNVNPHVIFIEDAIYSTCDLDHPHFYVRASRMKVVDQEEVFFTKARLYLLDIPYPIVFPYGYFPGSFSKKKSGLLPVVYSFQEQQLRGLGLQNLGWFQYFNDYITGSAAIDMFTSGTFFARSQLRYAKSNILSGSINLGYSVDQGMEPTDPDFSKRRQNRLNVQHNQRFSPYASVTADITLQTSEYLKRNSLNIDDRAEVSTNSFASYRYSDPDQRFTFSADVRQSQNFLNNTTDLTGPSTSFSIRTITPFKRSPAGLRRAKWYETFSLNYNNRFQSAFRFRPLDVDSSGVNWFEALLDPTKYRSATADDRHIDFGVRQEASMNVQLAGGEAIQVSAGANILQVLVPYTVQRFVNPDSNKTRSVSTKDLSLFHDGGVNVAMNARFYGIWNKNIGSITSIRHTLSPNVSINLRPDFGSDFWGYFARPIDERTGQVYIPVDPVTGQAIDNRYSRFERNVFGSSPSQGLTQILNFSVGNVLEAKQVKRDSTGERREQVLRLIDNLNLSSSYNLAAKEFRLSPLQASLSSSLIQRLNISAFAGFDFYATDANGNRVNRLLWSERNRPFRMTNLSINTGNQRASC